MQSLFSSCNFRILGTSQVRSCIRTQESTIGLLEKLITMLVTYHSSMLRLRGFRLLSDLPAVSSIDWRFSHQFLEESRAVQSQRVLIYFDVFSPIMLDFASKSVLKTATVAVSKEDLLHAAQRLETNASVRAAAMSALPCLVRAEGFRCSKALETF